MAIGAKKRAAIAEEVDKVRGRACNGLQSWSSGPPRQAVVVCRPLERMTALGTMEDHNRLLHSTDDGSGMENVAMRNRWVLAAICVLVALGLLLCAERESLAKQPARVPDPAAPELSPGRPARDRRARPWHSRDRRRLERSGRYAASPRTSGHASRPDRTARPRGEPKAGPEPAGGPTADPRAPAAAVEAHASAARGAWRSALTGESQRTCRGSTRKGIHGSPEARRTGPRTAAPREACRRGPVPSRPAAHPEAEKPVHEHPRATHRTPRVARTGPAGGCRISRPAGRVGRPAGQREYPYAGKRIGASAAGSAPRSGYGHGSRTRRGRPPTGRGREGSDGGGTGYEDRTANAPAGAPPSGTGMAQHPDRRAASAVLPGHEPGSGTRSTEEPSRRPAKAAAGTPAPLPTAVRREDPVQPAGDSSLPDQQVAGHSRTVEAASPAAPAGGERPPAGYGVRAASEAPLGSTEYFFGYLWDGSSFSVQRDQDRLGRCGTARAISFPRRHTEAPSRSGHPRCRSRLPSPASVSPWAVPFSVLRPPATAKARCSP